MSRGSSSKTSSLTRASHGPRANSTFKANYQVSQSAAARPVLAASDSSDHYFPRYILPTLVTRTILRIQSRDHDLPLRVVNNPKLPEQKDHLLNAAILTATTTLIACLMVSCSLYVPTCPVHKIICHIACIPVCPFPLFTLSSSILLRYSGC